MLNDYFDNPEREVSGLPGVSYFADRMNLSPNYLSDMLRNLTGQSAQLHIQQKLIDKAKELLSITDLSVAYRLGFEYLQSFSKLFKNKTDRTPGEFRASFN